MNLTHQGPHSTHQIAHFLPDTHPQCTMHKEARAQDHITHNHWKEQGNEMQMGKPQQSITMS